MRKGAVRATKLETLARIVGRDLDKVARQLARAGVRSPARYWVAGYPRLLAEWHPTKNGDLFPDEVSYGSHTPIWWTCSKGPDHVWCVAPHRRTSRNRGCPYCANRSVSVTNCVQTLAPELVSEWHPRRNGALTPQTAIAKSHRKVWWRCSDNPSMIAPGTELDARCARGKCRFREAPAKDDSTRSPTDIRTSHASGTARETHR